MAQSSKDKQPADPPSRRNWAGPVARDLPSATNEAFARAGFQDPTLILRWEEIAGPEIARITRPFKLSEGPHGAVLTLKAEPGAAVFLLHESRALCDRINAFLGHAAIARLRFVSGSFASPPQRQPLPKRRQSVAAADTASDFRGNETLRTALLRLAKSRDSGKSPPD